VAHCFDAYLDIETTGLSPCNSEITVVGIHLCHGDEVSFVQLVGKEATAENILAALKDVNTIYTYNGSRFDLPFIRRQLGIDLSRLYSHCDLMYHCWRRNLYGGLKSVERLLAIERRLAGVDGYMAVRLWWRYRNDYDEGALATLLEYNREDVLNLKVLRDRLF
jgi:uncharacterized protein YprB with RNaseH-like and TPR domain